MRTLGGFALALAFLAQGYAIGVYRERSVLLPRIECAYHEGSNEGYNTGRAELTRDVSRMGVLIRRNADGSQEIVPCVDCGKGFTPPVSSPPQTQRVKPALATK